MTGRLGSPQSRLGASFVLAATGSTFTIFYSVSATLPAIVPIVITDLSVITSSLIQVDLSSLDAVLVITPSIISIFDTTIRPGDANALVLYSITGQAVEGHLSLPRVVTPSIVAARFTLGDRIDCSAGSGDTPIGRRTKSYAF
jgi:hypothetical protein